MKKFKSMTIPIGEYDIELFRDLAMGRGGSFTWLFETDDGEPININFIKDNEENE